MVNGTHRLILRADVTHDAGHLVAHTLELSATHALVECTELAPLGDTVLVRLSFPRLVLPLELQAKVAAHHTPLAPGDPHGMTLAFEFRTRAERNVLRALITRIEAAAVADELQREAKRHGIYRVLLVEDNDIIRDMFAYGVRRYFRERNGHVSVDLASDGEQAWRMLADSDYDLAIVDFYLPVLDGARLIERLRAHPRLCATPVVAISVGGAEAREASLSAGADLFLHKPIVLRDLFATLERLTATGPTP